MFKVTLQQVLYSKCYFCQSDFQKKLCKQFMPIIVKIISKPTIQIIRSTIDVNNLCELI